MTPQHALSANLGALADKLAPYATSGATMEPVAVRAMVIMLLQCQAVAQALEEIATEAGACQVPADGERLGEAATVVDLSAYIGRRQPGSGEVVPFPGGAA
ncbi:MAG: hypothetical protein AB1698_20895 [Pseudomonadota bacterium]